LLIPVLRNASLPLQRQRALLGDVLLPVQILTIALLAQSLLLYELLLALLRQSFLASI
jgi:hypothetical protein